MILIAAVFNAFLSDTFSAFHLCRIGNIKLQLHTIQLLSKSEGGVIHILSLHTAFMPFIRRLKTIIFSFFNKLFQRPVSLSMSGVLLLFYGGFKARLVNTDLLAGRCDGYINRRIKI